MDIKRCATFVLFTTRNLRTCDGSCMYAFKKGFGDTTDISRLLDLSNVLVSLSDYYLNKDSNATYVADSNHIILMENGVCDSDSIKNNADIIIRIFGYDIYTSFKYAKEKQICISRIYAKEFEYTCDIIYNLMDNEKSLKMTGLSYIKDSECEMISQIFTRTCKRIVSYVQDQIRRYTDSHEERI